MTQKDFPKKVRDSFTAKKNILSHNCLTPYLIFRHFEIRLREPRLKEIRLREPKERTQKNTSHQRFKITDDNVL